LRLDDLTSEEFKKIMQLDPVIFVPIGATEAHGDHLPLSTDSLQPEAIAMQLAEKIGGLVAPPIRYGCHSSTKNMPGTISIRFETLRSIVYEILASLAKNGARKIVILSGHAGAVHMAALKLACQDAVEQFDLKLMLLTDYEIAKELGEIIKFDSTDGHGGLIETARLLAIAPDLVKSRRRKGKFLDKKFMIVKNPETCYPDGIVGDPTNATREIGERINNYIIERIEQLINENFGRENHDQEGDRR
jgi:creatinine amidohydrolase